MADRGSPSDVSQISARHPSLLRTISGPALGLSLLAAAGLGPLLFGTTPAHLLPAHRTVTAQWVGHVAVILMLGTALLVRALADRAADQGAVWQMIGFSVVAAVLTFYHWLEVDLRTVSIPPEQRNGRPADYPIVLWQIDVYELTLSHRKEDWTGLSYVPHVYRPLPCGFTRTLELISHDWQFSCFAYRWFFTTWFLWAGYRLSRLFHRQLHSWLTVITVAALYPFSIWYYWGQLTDPLSHALFALGFIYIIEDRWLPLAATLGLGVLSKETAILLVPGYWCCYWRHGGLAWFKSAGLLAACLAAYFAARLPVGWDVGLGSINATTHLMIEPNLFNNDPIYPSPAPVYMNYLLPLIFTGSFFPFILRHWRHIDYRLRALCACVTPLLLLSNLCFGWLHEARNYLPLIPLLTVAAMKPEVRPAPKTRHEAMATRALNAYESGP
jgi:hypothetical protein